MKESKIISMPDLKRVDEQAARWIMRLDDGDASQREINEFRQWVAASEHHRAAIARLRDLWGGLDILNSLNDIALSKDVSKSVKGTTLSRAVRKRSSVFGIAASIALVLVGALLVIGLLDTGNYQNAFATAVGEQQSVQLPDGSTIILNTSSAVRVNYTHDSRTVYLQSGEAFFDVASNRLKPFTVQTPNGVVTAVGTAFSVSLLAEQVEVVVTQGRVAVSPAIDTSLPIVSVNSPTSTLMEVTAGQSVAFSKQVERLRKIEPEAIERELDWRDGILNFKGEPLEQVIADISPYTHLEIEIKGEQLKQQPIGGYFKVGETDALFEALKLMANVDVVPLSERRVRLVRRSN